VQDEVERALATVLRQPAPLTVAGRTDRGVHAWGQVASYEGPPAPLSGLNGLLPDDVAALTVDEAPAGFDARRDARARTYCYRVFAREAPGAFERGRALWWPHRIDRDALAACAQALRGTHDFTAFTPSQTGHMRFERHVFDARWEERGDVLELWIEAESFLRHMNRVLVATMLEVAGARRSAGDFAALLEGAPRAAAGVTAPPDGLYLASVRYDGPVYHQDDR
jgi:tRNA pseudouridine38-40 synthase